MSKARICSIFNSQKGKLSKKALAVACSAAIGLAGLSGILPAVADTDEGTIKQAEFAESTVLFESDYDDVPDYASHRDDYGVDWGRSLAGNAFTQNIDGNGYIAYTQNSNTLGVIRLGHDYKTNTIGEYNYVKAIPGRTYVIEYDMKVYANYFAIKTNKLDQGWPQGGEGAYVGISVANPTADVKNKNVSQYIADTKDFVSYYEKVDTFELKSNPDSSTWEGNVNGWVHKTVEFTVPADLDVSVNNAIQLFMGNGIRCQISIDNIKVTSASKYTGEVLADEDYSDSSAGCDKKTSFFSKASNDITPVYDPSDTSNKVIQCIKSSSNYSHLYLGADYVIPGFDGTSGSWQESQNRVATQSITVEPGQKYYIKFKYKLTEGAETTEPRFFDLGIGTITHNTYGEIKSTLDEWGNNKNYDNVSNFITKDTAAVTEGWQTYETFYTAESINKTSDGVAMDKLAIICKIANNYYNIYFDDVTVIKISSEKSVVDSDTAIYDTEFADATVRSDRSQSDAFGDAYPVADPLDSSDKAVLYNGGYYNNGIIFIGSKMTDANEAKSSAISAKAGASYKVEFSYYVTGKLGNPTGNPLKIGIRVRSTSDNDENTNNAKYYNSYEEEILSINQPEDFSMTGYETVSATVTVPAGTDFSNGDKLGLYLKGQGVNVYIDNITVTELAPVSVKFVVNGESEYKVFGGNNISYSAAEGKSMLWYKDAAMKNSYALGLYNNNGVLGNLQVYGKQVESDAALIVGDVNMDSVFDDGDFNYLRKNLLSSEDAALKSEYRTDLNEDNTIDICDLVHIKKFALNNVADYQIGGTDLSDYKITGSVVYKPLLEEYLKITFSDSSEKEIVIGQNPSEMAELDENEYIVMLGADGKLYINGGNANAINAAILSFIGHVKTGKEISATYFVDFGYSGGDFPTTVPTLALCEDFSTDFTGPINYEPNPATLPYRENWFQTYDTDLSNTTTKAENGNLILYGESYTDEQSGATKYRGGEVNTRDLYNYGYFEIRAKVNASNGICPTFWLTGSRDSDSKIEYEVDVFECFGKEPNYLKSTLLAHNYPNGAENPKTSTETNFTYEQLTEIIEEKGKTYFYNENGWGDEYHTFGLDWKYDSITWYIDGIAVLRATPSKAAEGQYVFNEPMRVRLTCYAGRALGGTIDENTDWVNGNSLIVDYLKIYQYN